jgi:multidrug transporter EmrE-like cation transporter
MKYLIAILLFAAYVAASCMGLYMIKAAQAWKSVPFLGGVLLYGLGAALWLVILRYFPLSLAFPVAAGALIVCTMLTGRVFLQEAISGYQLAGGGLIILGIFLTAARS